MVTVENMYLLNTTGNDENRPPSNDLDVQMQVCTKYSLFNDTLPLDRLLIHHKYDNKTMVLKNGKMFYTKSYI
jgi:hypothetical protein